MKIEKAENWNRKERRCEHCGGGISKDDPIILLFTEITKFPITYRGIAFHDGCAKEHFEELIHLL